METPKLKTKTGQITVITYTPQQELEKEAYLMVKLYGYEEAYSKALTYAEDCVKEIRAMPSYDVERCTAIENKKWFWFSVATTIKNYAKR